MSKTQTLEQAGTLTESEFTQTPSAGELVTAGPWERLAEKIAHSLQSEEERKRIEREQKKAKEKKSAMRDFLSIIGEFAWEEFRFER